MKQYLARLVFAIEFDGCITECEEQLRVVSACSETDALRAAEQIGEDFGGYSRASDGAAVRWMFKGVTACVPLSDQPPSKVLFSNTIGGNDLNGFLSYVHCRWKHLVDSAVPLPETERK